MATRRMGTSFGVWRVGGVIEAVIGKKRSG